MKMTKIEVHSGLDGKTPDVMVHCLMQKANEKPDIPKGLRSQTLKKACDLGDFKADENDLLLIYEEEEAGEGRSLRTAYVGIGKVGKGGHNDAEFQERLREAGGHIASLCRKLKAAKLCVIPPRLTRKPDMERAIYCLCEGILLGDYSFQKYSTKKKEKERHEGLGEIIFLVAEDQELLADAARRAKIVAGAVCQARDMANEPGNCWTAGSFASYAEDLADRHQMKCTIFDKDMLAKLGMGGILAVNKGSEQPPCMVVLEYHAADDAQTVLLVGKGLTFDSGGISLKPAAGMEDMKYDMCGGAAVLAAMNVIGQEKPRCNVVAIVPATDNMAGGGATKPADIIYHYNKTTAEIINTDAEGRLILADALAYGIEKYVPDYVVDLATLTGAVIIGLGHHHTGLLSNDDKLADKLLAAGRNCGEPLWRLPLGAAYRKQIDSKVADIKNTGGKAGGAITAAEYLHSFVGSVPWAHLDIAGTAWNFTERRYIPEGGPSGTGVRTLVEFIRAM